VFEVTVLIKVLFIRQLMH